MDALKPPRLRKGDLIGLVSPAGTPSTPDKIEKSVRYLEALGYAVIVGKNAAAIYGYLAGEDDQRVSDFNGMIHDPRVRAIFSLRGGYGSPRLLRHLDYAALRRQPKIISGFSDITALQLAIFRRCRLVTFSGPLPAVEFWQGPDPYTEEHFWRLITSPQKVGTLANPPDAGLVCLHAGSGTGLLLGGNLVLLASCFGTPFLPRLSGSVLVLEEVSEEPYRVDRLLTQIENSGVAKRLSGVLFGHFTHCKPKDPAKPHRTTDAVLRDFASRLNCPALANLQYGHIERKLTIPLGLMARINGTDKQIEVPESAVM